MTPLWTVHDLLEATGGTIATPFAATGISIDTRTLQPGDLFVALRSETGDGHDFAADALARGAAGAMVHRDVPGDGRLLRVDDTRAALHRLGGYRAGPVRRSARRGHRQRRQDDDEGDAAGDPECARPHACRGRVVQQPLGPAADAGADAADSEFCVVEIGMNHPGEIAPLARLARPHVAVIIAVEKAHIGFLGSIEAIADEKASILRALEPGGVAVLPADSPLFPRLRAAAGDAAIVSFGAAPRADVRLVDIAADADGSDVVAELYGQRLTFRLNAPGRHMAMNALAALAASVHLSRYAGEVVERSDAGEGATCRHPLPPRCGDLSRIAGEVYRNFAPIAGRGARRRIAIPGGSALLLDESYNGNPASMRAALAVLRLQPAQRRIAVLGDMLELGEHGPAEHRALAADVAAAADRLFACGPLMGGLFAAVPEPMRGATRRTPHRWRRSSRAPWRQVTPYWSRAASAAA